MAPVTLRPATLNDVDPVLHLWSVAAENADRPSDSAADVVGLLDRDPDALVVATDGEQLVGSIIAGWDGWRCHLYRLAVHPDHRRRGLGRLLIEHAERRFNRAGGKRSDAMVLDGNHLAGVLWASAGYARQPEWSRWVKPLPQRPTDS